MDLFIPPQDLDAEVATLGAVLLDNKAFPRVANLITRDDYYRNAHRLIFDAMTTLHRKQEAIDLITLPAALKETNTFEAAGGVIAIAGLADGIPSAANVAHYAKIVKEKSTARMVLKYARGLQGQIEEGVELKEVISDMRRGVSEISMNSTDVKVFGMKEAAMVTFKHLEQLHGMKGALTGITTGIERLDKHTSGHQNGELIIVAGRPSMGKSVLAKDFGLNSGVPTALFSLEMSVDSYVKRIFSDKANIDHDRTRTGKLADSDFPKLAKVCGELINTPFYLVDEGYMTLDQIIDTSERLKVEKDIQLIIIDYLQLIKARSAKGKSREQEVGEISRELKGLARRLNIPVIALSQLTRKVEERPDKRPVESDLRESGSLEQDADVIYLLYRPGKYFKDCDIKKIYKGWDNPPDSLQGVAELIIAKGRDVQLGTVFIKEELKHQRFSDYYARESDWDA